MFLKEWNVLAEKLFLQGFCSRRNHDAFAAANRGNQIRQSFPCASAGFEYGVLPLLKRCLQNFRHLQLRAAMLVSLRHALLQQSTGAENIFNCRTVVHVRRDFVFNRRNADGLRATHKFRRMLNNFRIVQNIMIGHYWLQVCERIGRVGALSHAGRVSCREFGFLLGHASLVSVATVTPTGLNTLAYSEDGLETTRNAWESSGIREGLIPGDNSSPTNHRSGCDRDAIELRYRD